MKLSRTSQQFRHLHVLKPIARQAFDPARLAGLVQWYRADALALADGAPVAAWPDSSGNGVAATAFGGVTYKAAVAAGRPVVRLDGSTGYLAFPNAGVGSLPTHSIFMVLAQYADVNLFARIYMNDYINGSVSIASYLASYAAYYYFGAPGGSLNTSAIFSSTFSAAEFQFDGTTRSVSSNGALIASDTPAHAPNALVGTSGFIGGDSGAGDYLQADIAEILVYSPALSTANLALVNSYLRGKYQLY